VDDERDFRDFWLSIRRGLLIIVDAIERKLGITPLTTELRRWWKALGRK